MSHAVELQIIYVDTSPQQEVEPTFPLLTAGYAR